MQIAIRRKLECMTEIFPVGLLQPLARLRQHLSLLLLRPIINNIYKAPIWKRIMQQKFAARSLGLSKIRKTLMQVINKNIIRLWHRHCLGGFELLLNHHVEEGRGTKLLLPTCPLSPHRSMAYAGFIEWTNQNGIDHTRGLRCCCLMAPRVLLVATSRAAKRCQLFSR